MGHPSEDHPGHEAASKKHARCRDGIHIHPYRPACAVEVRPARAVLAATKPLLPRVLRNHHHRLELGPGAAHVVAPGLGDRLATRAPIVDGILLHMLNVWSQLG